MRKRRHQKRPKFKKAKKKKKKEKKSRTFPLIRLHNKHTKRERKQCREKKKMSENTNNKQMTTRERQQIEVAKLEAELNALKVDAFAKVRCCFFFFVTLLRNSFRRHHHFQRWLCVLNHDDEISSLSIRALSSRFSAATTARQKPKRVYFYTR